MTLLDHEGRPVQNTDDIEDIDMCPKCSGPKKDFEVITPGFGGYWKVICKRCGGVVQEGRKKAEI